MSNGGRCLCGAVTLAITSDPVATRMCWCRLCQYLAAGNATVNAFFRSEDVAISGELSWFRSVADSGNHLERGFCPSCGTQVISRAVERPHLVAIRAGVLDDPALAAPQTVIWTSAAPEWAVLDPELPHVEGQPGPVG